MVEGKAEIALRFDEVTTLPVWQKAIGDHLSARQKQLVSFWLCANVCDGIT